MYKGSGKAVSQKEDTGLGSTEGRDTFREVLGME